jgi:hypothetical protein
MDMASSRPFMYLPHVMTYGAIDLQSVYKSEHHAIRAYSTFVVLNSVSSVISTWRQWGTFEARAILALHNIET